MIPVNDILHDNLKGPIWYKFLITLLGVFPLCTYCFRFTDHYIVSSIPYCCMSVWRYSFFNRYWHPVQEVYRWCNIVLQCRRYSTHRLLGIRVCPGKVESPLQVEKKFSFNEGGPEITAKPKQTQDPSIQSVAIHVNRTETKIVER